MWEFLKNEYNVTYTAILDQPTLTPFNGPCKNLNISNGEQWNLQKTVLIINMMGQIKMCVCVYIMCMYMPIGYNKYRVYSSISLSEYKWRP